MNLSQVDVLIVGAGPVGLFCANELARHNISYCIIDKKSTLSVHSKALGLHVRTLDMLEDCGLYQQFKAAGLPVSHIMVQKGKHLLAEMDFTQLKVAKNFLLDIPQDKTEAILYHNLSRAQTVEWQNELVAVTQEKDAVIATLKQADEQLTKVTAKWLIACDGAHSTVRHLLNIPFTGSAYLQQWWLADLHIDWHFPKNKMVLFPSVHGPLACFPLDDNRYRIILTAPNNDSLDFAEIKKEFLKRSEVSSHLYDPIWITPFSIHHRQIPKYQYDRVFFCGDSAHIHSPIGAQGLNTGLQDVYNLAWKLALVNKKIAHPGLLATYNEERYPIGKNVVKKTDIMTRVILFKNPLLIKLRNIALRIILNSKCLRSTILQTVAELDISYAKNSLSFKSSKPTKFKLGAYCPFIHFINNQTQTIASLADICQGTKHQLVLFINKINYQHLQKKLNKFEHQQWIGIVFVLLEENTIIDENFYRVANPEAFNKRYQLNYNTALLIRPDKYIAMIQSPIDISQLETYLNTMLNFSRNN